MSNNNGVFQSIAGLRYTVLGTRMSGESSTSLGNTLVNYYVQKFIFNKLNVLS